MDALAKELKTRKRIASIYNKAPEDFATKEQWDDYLEDVEDIVYNLANNIDVQQTEARVAEYARANRASIIAAQAKQAGTQRRAQLEASGQAKLPAAPADDGQAAGPASYVPAVSALPSAAAQPVPLRPAHMDKSGNLLPAPGTRPPSLADHDPAVLAAAWSPSLPRARALQEALASLLLFDSSQNAAAVARPG